MRPSTRWRRSQYTVRVTNAAAPTGVRLRDIVLDLTSDDESVLTLFPPGSAKSSPHAQPTTSAHHGCRPTIPSRRCSSSSPTPTPSSRTQRSTSGSSSSCTRRPRRVPRHGHPRACTRPRRPSRWTISSPQRRRQRKQGRHHQALTDHDTPSPQSEMMRQNGSGWFARIALRCLRGLGALGLRRRHLGACRPGDGVLGPRSSSSSAAVASGASCIASWPVGRSWTCHPGSAWSRVRSSANGVWSSHPEQ